MTEFKKRIVVFYIIATLVNGAFMVRSVQSAENGTVLEKVSSESLQSQPFQGAENSGLFERDSSFSERSGYFPDQGDFCFRAMLAILFVVVLGVAAIYVSKKLLPQIARVPGKEIHIVETVHLGPRKAVHLINIGNQRFLIGSTNENVTKLADLNEDFAGLPEQETN